MRSARSATESPTPGAELPFISVILPVLNGEGRLEHALAALREQRYPADRFELIVADGGSTDATARIARDAGAIVVPNPGVTVAAGRNAGIVAARGDLLAFSEDDIVVPPHWLANGVAELERWGADAVGGPTPLPRDASAWSAAINALFRLASDLGASVQSDRLKVGEANDLPGGNSIYRAASLRQVTPIDEGLTTAEDVAMHLAMRQRGMRLIISDALRAEHRKRDDLLGFYRQIVRFAVGRVQLQRRRGHGLSLAHHAMAWLGLVLTAGLVLGLLSTTRLTLALCALGALGLALGGLFRRESPRAAALLPLAGACFVMAWTAGYFSERLLPAVSARRPFLGQKLGDLARGLLRRRGAR